MALVHRSALLVAVLSLGIASAASAEIFRWTDADGQEHFTMDLHRVPAEHRAEARRRAELDAARADSEGEKINTMKTPDHLAVKRALRPRTSQRSRYGRPAPAAAADAGCASWHRSRGDELRRNITRWEKQVELNEQKERRLVRTEDRLRAENRVEKYQIYLEQAQAALEDFEDEMRRKGVPPGCYR